MQNLYQDTENERKETEDDAGGENRTKPMTATERKKIKKKYSQDQRSFFLFFFF